MGKPSAQILSFFPLLASHDTPTRLDASASLIRTTLDDGGESVEYTVRRLVNGLASSNQASRQGFAVALTELVSRLPDEEAKTVLPLILETSTATARTDAQDERGLLLARLVGVQAVISSGIVVKEEGMEKAQEMANALVSLAHQKAWLVQPAYWVLQQEVQTVLASDADWRDEFVRWILNRVFTEPREKMRGWSPEKVALVVTLQVRGVSADYASLIEGSPLKNEKLLARENLQVLSTLLKGSSGAPPSKTNGFHKGKAARGANAISIKNATPSATISNNTKPHYVWDVLFDAYWGSEPHQLEGVASWNDLWRVLVEGALFDSDSTAEKHTAFLLLIRAIQTVPMESIPGLFQSAAIRTLANNLRRTSGHEKALQKVAERVVAALLGLISDEKPSPEGHRALLSVVKALTSAPHGSHTFDPKTIERIVSKLDTPSSEDWISHLIRFAVDTAAEVDGQTAQVRDVDDDTTNATTDEKLTLTLRLWAFDQILHTTRHLISLKTAEQSSDLFATVLEFYAVFGWFDVKRKEDKGARSYTARPALGEKARAEARSRFFSVVTQLISTKTLSEGQWLSKAVSLLDNLSADTKNFARVYPEEEDSEVESLIARTKEAYGKLGKKNDLRSVAARRLIDGVTLLAYDADEQTSEVLESLLDALGVLFEGVVESGVEEDEEDEGEEEDKPHSSTVLVDVILQLLRRPSAFVKTFSRQVFLGFHKELVGQALDLMLEQIIPEVVEVEGEEEEEEDEEKEESDSGSDSDSNSDDEYDNEDSMEPSEEFKNQLLAALQGSGLAVDDDATEESEEEEVVLDDEQMLELDDKLADIFRSRVSGPRSRKAAARDDAHYRMRVADLIEDFVKADASNPLRLNVIIPFVNILRSGSSLDKELKQKAARIIRLVTTRKENATSVTVEDPEELVSAVKQLLDLSVSVSDPTLTTPLLTQCAVYYTKFLASAGVPERFVEEVAQLFFDQLKTYSTQKNAKTRVQPALTIDFIKRSPAVAQKTFEAYLGLLAPGVCVNAFRYLQAFDVCKMLFSYYGALRTDESKKRCLDLIPVFRNHVVHIIRNATEPGDAIFDTGRLKELLKMSLVVIRVTKACSDNEETVDAIWGPEELVALLDAFETADVKKATSVKHLLRQMITLIQSAVVVNGNGKRKPEESQGEEGKSSTTGAKSKKKSRRG